MNPTIVNPQTGTELLPVPPAPLAAAAPHASMDLRFDLESIVAIGVNETLASLDEAKRKVVTALDATAKYLTEKRRELADELTSYGCPDLRADIEELCKIYQKLGDSARVTYSVSEPDRKKLTYVVTAQLSLLKNTPQSFPREQALSDNHKAILADIEKTESRNSKLSAALAELGRRSNEGAITRQARAAAAKHVYSRSEDGKQLVEAISQSVVKAHNILADLLPGESL